MTLVTGDSAHGARRGLGFRCQDDYHRYALELGGDGYYSLWPRDGSGPWARIVDWDYSPAINHLGQHNHVEVVLSGSSITVNVNGTFLFTKVDGTYPSGSIGLFLDANTVAGRAVFDNVKVWSK